MLLLVLQQFIEMLLCVSAASGHRNVAVSVATIHIIDNVCD